MATRVVEGKKPYTGGQAIDIDENKVISLRLRDENNLIIYDEGDDEIYVDLQLPDEITPTDAFPIGVNTGRVVVDNGWDKAGTIICAKTTSGDVIKLVYADEGTLWIDNGTGTFKQIYFKSDVDGIITTLTTYINTELAKKQNGVASTTAPSNPSEGDLWYDTTNSAMKVWDGTAWQSVGTGGGGSDIVYATQAEYNALLPGAESDNKHYFIYEESGGGGGWKPGANTLAYYPLDSINTVNDLSGNSMNLTNSNVNFGTYNGVDCAYTTGRSQMLISPSFSGIKTLSLWTYWTGTWGGSGSTYAPIYTMGSSSAYNNLVYNMKATLSATDYRLIVGNLDISSPTQQWYNFVLTGDGTTTGLYINGQYTGVYNGGIGTDAFYFFVFSTNQTGIDCYIGGMNEVILEDKTRTAQEIADYFNQTKANYGIS